jgi:hypothetical protein
VILFSQKEQYKKTLTVFLGIVDINIDELVNEVFGDVEVDSKQFIKIVRNELIKIFPLSCDAWYYKLSIMMILLMLGDITLLENIFGKEKMRRLSNVPKVNNLKQQKIQHSIYIGRPSKWGNPFPMKKESERQNVVLRFFKYALKKEQYAKAIFDELNGKTLSCFCINYHDDILRMRPNEMKCHGQVIAWLYAVYMLLN